jgi:penicillin-binding protein 1C
VKRLLLFLLVITALVLAVPHFLRMAVPKPPLMEGIPFSRLVEDRHGATLRISLSGDEKYRLPSRLRDISPVLIEATLLYEDRYFYSHHGANPLALVRAAWSTVSGGRRLGASTLTMQLARIRFGLHTRTPCGKLVQIARALQLDLHYTKDELLEAYLTLAPYGANIEGAEAASRLYFGKSAKELTLSEALTLAVIPQSPSARTPVTPGGKARLEEARSLITRLWMEAHPEDRKDLAFLALPVQVLPEKQRPFGAPHFCEMALRESGSRDAVIRTTLDLNLQRALETRIGRFVEQRRSEGIRNACAVLVDVETAEVLSWVGSAGFHDAAISGQVDGMTMRRSPGSALKPFIYAMAMDRGLIFPGSILVDAPRRFAGYAPENFDRSFAGPIPAGRALVESRNVPAVSLLDTLSPSAFHDFLERGGVQGLRPAGDYGLTLALGGCEVSPRELAQLYTMLANGGNFRPLRWRQDGKEPPVVPLLRPEAAFLALDMLRNARPPSGAAPLKLPTAFKTGTSHGFRDAWCAGLVGRYALVVWVGDFQGAGNPALLGRTAAAPLFFQIASSLQSSDSGSAIPPWTDPSGLNLVPVEVCAETGLLAGANCREKKKSWFIPGVSPITACTGDARITPERSVAAAPVILSPQKSVTYLLGSDSRQSLSLLAEETGLETPLCWFANRSFLGRSTPGEPLDWWPRPGTYEITVVDERGGSTSTEIRVEMAPAG